MATITPIVTEDESRHIEALFTDDIVNYVIHRLKITNETANEEILKVLIDAAKVYTFLKKQREEALTPGEAIRKLDRFIEATEEVELAWESLMGDFYIRNYLTSQGALLSVIENTEQTNEWFLTDLQRYKSLAENLKERSRLELGIAPQFALEEWVILMEKLLQFSKEKFTHGGKRNGRYQSKFFQVLCKTIKQLDPNIEESTIATRIEDIKSQRNSRKVRE